MQCCCCWTWCAASSSCWSGTIVKGLYSVESFGIVIYGIFTYYMVFLTHLSTYVIRFLVSGSQGHWKTSRSLWRLFPLLVLNMWGCRLQFINIFLVIIKLNMFRWLQLCKWREKHIFTWAMGSFGFLLVSPNKLQIILTKVHCLFVVCCFVCTMFLFVQGLLRLEISCSWIKPLDLFTILPL